MRPPPRDVPGTQGYAAQAGELVARYEAVHVADKYRPVQHLLPQVPGRVLDVGAGTGADAAWFAAHAHAVLAVEPTAALREAGMTLHASPRIEWMDDHLPALARVMARRQRYDLVVLSAVFMHLDAAERRSAMPRLAALLAPGGVLLISLRHGPVPAGRRMFDVAGDEVALLAQACGLTLLLQVETASVQPENRAAGVTWTQLAFRRRDETLRSPAPG
ncbi:MAG: methyltransferase domain-containing protein [Rhizobacter sp.]|nr:methyltransferase domain-containing protein [Rhizobacter sp.]